jgi:hypothetical protein
LGNFVLFDGLPVTRRGGIDGSRLEDSGGNSVEEGTVDDISVAGDPTDIGHASEVVVWMDVEDVFDGYSGSKEVAAGGMDNALWLSSGSRGLDLKPVKPPRKDRVKTHVETEKRILGLHNLGRAVARNLEGFFMPPFITSFSPGNSFASPPGNENMFNQGALLEMMGSRRP